MRTRLISALQTLLGLGLLALLAWVLYLAFSGVFRYLSQVESEVAVAIIAASATALVSVMTLVLTKHHETEATIKQELRTRKVPVYEKIIQTLFKINYAEKLQQEELSEQELLHFFVETTEQMVIWGSDEMLLAYRKFRMNMVEGADPIDTIFRLEELLLAIRKDLGHKNRGFKRGTVLGLWVNDVDEYASRTLTP